jgi:glycosyltransferase involved in cell wall biosynthesis
LKSRLVFVLPGTDTGGMERFLLRLLPRMSEIAEVSVVVRSSKRGALDDLYAETGCAVYYQPVGYLDPVGKIRLFRLFRRLRPDTVCDLSGIFSGVALAVARLAWVPHRVTFHRRSSFAFQPTLLRRLYARLSIALVESMACAILANSETALRFFHPRLCERKDSRLAVIRNMVDPQELVSSRSRRDVRNEIGVPETAPMVLHVGRLDPAKDHDTLLRAMAQVIANCPEVHCVLVGPRTESLASHPVIAAASLGDRFRLLGDRRDVPDLLAAADLFLFTSVTEGMPNALVEAMMVGLPVVASDITPIRELIPERGQDALVSPGDVKGFAHAILQILSGETAKSQHTYQAEIGELTAPDRILSQLCSRLLPQVGLKPS